LRAELAGLSSLMGLLQSDAEQWFTQVRRSDDISSGEIEGLIDKRQSAKADKDFAGADQIRKELLVRGVVLEDSREGTKWRRG
jgi:cysteinyl-tRNA synthetase